MPIFYLTRMLLGDKLPNFPGQNFPLIYIRPGEFAVHLAGLYAFWLLELNISIDNQNGKRESLNCFSSAIGPCLGVICFILTTSARGPMFSVFVSVLIVLIARPTLLRNRYMIIAVILVFSICVLLDLNFAVENIQRVRERSPKQILINFY